MKIDRSVNKLLEKVFGVTEDGECRLDWHSQNLNEDRHGHVKGWPYHGRCWLRFHRSIGRKVPNAVCFSWNLWSTFCGAHVSLDSDCEDTLVLHASFPPVSLWLSTDGPAWLRVLAGKLAPGEQYAFEQKRELSFRVHHNDLWWLLWMNPDSSKSSDPKWRRGHFDIKNFLLGEDRREERNIRHMDIGIPMPEGVYAAKLKLYDDVRTNRFYSETFPIGCVEIEGGIPSLGKGENSWDCGEDAVFGQSCTAKTPEEAIAAVVQGVLRDRRRHDGNINAKYPPPEVHLAEFRKRQTTRKDENHEACTC